MKQIYRDSFDFFRASFPFLLLVGGGIELIIWYLQPDSEGISTTISLILLAYLFHRHFLFGEKLAFRQAKPTESAPPHKFGLFILVSLAMILVPVFAALPLAAMLTTDFSSLGYLATVLALYLLSLSMFGTVLPASVARDGTWRLSHGLRRTGVTMLRLLLGPAVVGLVLFVVFNISENWLLLKGFQPDGMAFLASFILARTFGFLTTILAVAVLCQSYRDLRPYADTQPA
ncbi:hypothetical protein [Paragemmobacter ruber]|uniref:Uncharacterized protein n=1 Tax=Paragemmobacter ruber TaxID=1985673 RepID=A0ABW9Y2Z4_9RHOB|nr:hypothetical protein [Rhodobacter ruber]NBE06879.1 hypothetical protein [Rhodobacter ruber]